MKRKYLILLCLCMAMAPLSRAQDAAHIKQPYHYNVIKFNPTPMLIWNMHNITFSYERIWKSQPNQSMILTIGYLELPDFLPDEILGILSLQRAQKYGINVGVDYRFYLTRQNANPAPNGIYISPYVSYYGYHFSNNLQHADGEREGTMDGTLQILNLGFGLGYQFLIAKRLTIDLMLFGPSISMYNHERSLTIQLDEDERTSVDHAVSESIKEKFPLFTSFLGGSQLSKTGKSSTISVGFRYNIQFGFHF